MKHSFLNHLMSEAISSSRMYFVGAHDYGMEEAQYCFYNTKDQLIDAIAKILETDRASIAGLTIKKLWRKLQDWSDRGGDSGIYCGEMQMKDREKINDWVLGECEWPPEDYDLSYMEDWEVTTYFGNEGSNFKSFVEFIKDAEGK